MKRSLKFLLPLFLAILLIASACWYLFVYDRDFTRDVLMSQARYFEQRGNTNVAAVLYDLAYEQSGGDAAVAIELADAFKADGNYTKAEVTLSKAIADGGSAELYIALCKTYLEQDKLLDAVTMLDNIADPDIRAQLDELRPAAPTADPADGHFSQYITVTISCEGKLYMTNNQQYPSLSDYTQSGQAQVQLHSGENVFYTLCIGENGLISPLQVFSYTVSGVIEKVTFTDAQIDSAVRGVLGVGATDELVSSDLWTVTALELPLGASGYSDFAHLPQLTSLTITGSVAESLDGITALTNLKQLTICDSYLSASDLALIAQLSNLERLTLTNCGLSNIEALSALKHLKYLDLSSNSIGDFTALSFMTSLEYLDLSHNAVTSLNAISALTTLQTLKVAYNSLTSVTPVAGCAYLCELDLSHNTITSLSGVDQLTQLTKLNASYNSLTDVLPLGSCTALVQLDISSNALTDISCLSALNLLENFYFSRNEVSVLPTWSPDCALLYIDGSYNQITTVSLLSGFVNLNYVIMDYNLIESVNSLANCYNLVKVSVYGNPVTDVSALKDNSIQVDYNPLS